MTLIYRYSTRQSQKVTITMFYRIKSENIVYVAFSENFNVHIVAHFFLLPAIGIRNGWKCIWNDSSNTAAPSENQILKRTRKNCDSSLYFDLCVWVFLNGTKAPLQNPPSSLSLSESTHIANKHTKTVFAVIKYECAFLMRFTSNLFFPHCLNAYCRYLCRFRKMRIALYKLLSLFHK